MWKLLSNYEERNNPKGIERNKVCGRRGKKKWLKCKKCKWTENIKGNKTRRPEDDPKMALGRKLRESRCGQKSDQWNLQKASLRRAESCYFPFSGVWLLLQNTVSVLDCCSWEFSCTGFGSVDQNKCHQLHKIMIVIKTCLKYPNICMCHKWRIERGKVFKDFQGHIFVFGSFKHLLSDFFFWACASIKRSAEIIKTSHTLNTQSNANIYTPFWKFKLHRELNLQFNLQTLYFNTLYSILQPNTTFS